MNIQGSFAEQVKQAVKTKEYRSGGDEAPKAEAPATPAVTEKPADDIMNNGLQAKEEAVLPEGNKASEIPPASSETKSPTKVKMLGKEFSSVEEAMLYAETQAAEAKGFKEAVDKLSKPAEEIPQTPQEPDFFETVENEIFVNPKEGLKKVYAKAKEDAVAEVRAQLKKEAEELKAEETRKENYKAFWNDFYKANSDLQDFKEEVDYIMEKNWLDVKDLPLEKANAEIANLTRSRIKKLREATMPRKELSSAPAVVAGGSAGPGASATNATAKTNLDFISQLNKHRKRG